MSKMANIICGFISVAEGLVAILSLGTWTPMWTYDFVYWWVIGRDKA